MQKLAVDSRPICRVGIKRWAFAWLYPDDRFETFLVPWIIISLSMKLAPFFLLHTVLSTLLFVYSVFRVDENRLAFESGTSRPHWMERFSVLGLVILWFVVTISAFYTAVSIVLWSGPGSAYLLQVDEGIIPSSFWLQIWKLAAWIVAVSSILFSLQFAWWVQKKLVFALALLVVPFQLWLWTSWVLHGTLY